MALPTPQAVREFLVALGSTADEVYASLKERGVYAQMADHNDIGNHHPRRCPIAVVLRLQFPELTDEPGWGVRTHSVWLGGGSADVPDAVRDFIRAYDDDDQPTYRE